MMESPLALNINSSAAFVGCPRLHSYPKFSYRRPTLADCRFIADLDEIPVVGTNGCVDGDAGGLQSGNLAEEAICSLVWYRNPKQNHGIELSGLSRSSSGYIALNEFDPGAVCLSWTA